MSQFCNGRAAMSGRELEGVGIRKTDFPAAASGIHRGKPHSVRIVMTTTTPGCPATNYLRQGAGESVSAVPGVEFVEVKLTYEPRWTTAMMSPEAKAHFGIEDGSRP